MGAGLEGSGDGVRSGQAEHDERRDHRPRPNADGPDEEAEGTEQRHSEEEIECQVGARRLVVEAPDSPAQAADDESHPDCRQRLEPRQEQGDGQTASQ